MTALRFQTGGRHQTSPASLWGQVERVEAMIKPCKERVNTATLTELLGLKELKLAKTWAGKKTSCSVAKTSRK